jgi:hypothetical protein
MPARSALITPFEFSTAGQAAQRLWRKKILPIGEIIYNGAKYKFDQNFLQGIVDSFRDGAFDQVPLQLANDKNEHTNNPEQYRGDIVDMELTADGLWGVIKTTARGSEVLHDNPSLGVSARIVQEYTRADGKHYPAAIQHVLATLDPRLTGLGEWQAIEAANSDDCDTINLSGSHYEETNTVADLTDAEKAQLRALLAKADDKGDDKNDKTPPAPATPPPSVSPDAPENGGTGNPPATTPGDNGTGTTGGVGADPEGQLTDVELDDLIAEAEAALTGDPELEGQPVGAELSNAYQAALELANAELEDQRAALGKVTAHVNEQKFAAEKRMFADEYGIPPRLVDLAKPLLLGDPKTIDLANGETADPGSVMRQVLTEMGGLIKILDLGNELGSGVEGEAAPNAELAEATKAIRSLLSL